MTLPMVTVLMLAVYIVRVPMVKLLWWHCP